MIKENIETLTTWYSASPDNDDIRLADFLMRVIATSVQEDTVHYIAELKFKKEGEVKTENVYFSGAQWSNKQKFIETLWSTYPISYYATPKQHDQFIANAMTLSDSRSAVFLKSAGMHKDFFLEDKKIITKDGKQKLDGIFNYGDKVFIVSKAAQQVSRRVSMSKMNEDTTKKLQTFLDGLSANQKGSYIPVIILSYLKASLYASWIHDKYRFFPILFVGGQKESGKNFLLHHCLRVMGLVTDGEGIASVSKVGIERIASNFHDFPVWIDEYRSDYATMEKTQTLFRSIYNRSTGVKGVAGEANTLMEIQPTSTLIVSGESMPTDSATRDRMVRVYLQKSMQVRTERSAFEIDNLSDIGYMWVQGRIKSNPSIIIDGVERCREYIRSQHPNVSDRVQRSYAILMYFAQTIFDEVEGNTEFASDINHGFDDFIRQDISDRIDVDHVAIFFNIMMELVAQGRINEDIHFKVEGDNLMVHYSSVYDEIKKHRKQLGEQVDISKTQLRDYIVENYNIPKNEQSVVINFSKGMNDRKSVRVMQIPLSSLPMNVSEYFNS